MKLQLNYTIPIDIQEDGKSKEKFEVLLREPTAKEQKAFRAEAKKFKTLQNKLGKVERKAPLLQQRANAFQKLEKFEEELETIEELIKLEEQLDKDLEKLESLTGGDFTETEAKNKFDTFVSGEHVEKLRVHAEAQGYTRVMSMLFKAKSGLLKKDSTK